MIRLWTVAALFTATAACTTAPRFSEIEKVEVYYLSESGGLTIQRLTKSKERDLKRCLISETKPITAENREMDLLPTSYLIQVTDAKETVSMELLSESNLTDRKGFYENPCVYKLVSVDTLN
jgi:hypothetical protein